MVFPVECLDGLKYQILGDIKKGGDIDIVFKGLSDLRKFKKRIFNHFNREDAIYKVQLFDSRIYDDEIKIHVFNSDGNLLYQLDLWIKVQKKGYLLYEYQTDSSLNDNIYYCLDNNYKAYKKKQKIPFPLFFLIQPLSIFRLIYILLKKIIKPKIFVFYGPDGVGKSTQLELLKDKIYNNIYSYHTNPKILSRLKKSTNKDVSNVRCFEQLSFIKANLYLMYVAFDFIIFHIFCIFKKNSVFIFDRHFLEFIVQERYVKMITPFINLIYKLFIKIDRGFILYAEPTKIFERKNELPINILTHQLNLYKGLVKYPNLNLIDCNRSIKKVKNDITFLTFS